MVRKQRADKADKNKESNKLILKPKGGLRAIFVHLDEPDDYGSGDKYTVTVLIPKKDKKTVEQVKSAIAAAMEKGKKEVWSGKNHKKANNPLRDGDDEDTEKYPYYKDCYFIQAKSTVKPSVMDLQRHHLEGSEEVYSGMYIYLSMATFAYLNEGWGVTMILGNVIKVADGERLSGGGFDVDDEFGDVLEDDEFNDDEDDDEDDGDDEDDEDDEDDDEDDEGLDYSDAEDLIEEANDIKGGKAQVRKLLKAAGVKKLTDITDEDDLDDLMDALEEWIEDNED